MTVQAADKTTSAITVPDLNAADLPTPDTAEFSGNHIGSWNVRISGIGGTGVSTLAAIIRTAAHVDGLHVHGVDQTGLAQKGGSVLSDIRLSSVPIDEPGHVPEGAADLILSLDGLTTAADKTLEILNEERTTAVFSTTDVPTGTMVTNTKALRTNPVMLSDSLADRVAKSLIMDAADVSEQLFGKSTYQTMILFVGRSRPDRCSAGVPSEPRSSHRRQWSQRWAEYSGVPSWSSARWGRQRLKRRTHGSC